MFILATENQTEIVVIDSGDMDVSRHNGEWKGEGKRKMRGLPVIWFLCSSYASFVLYQRQMERV